MRVEEAYEKSRKSKKRKLILYHNQGFPNTAPKLLLAMFYCFFYTKAYLHIVKHAIHTFSNFQKDCFRENIDVIEKSEVLFLFSAPVLVTYGFFNTYKQ